MFLKKISIQFCDRLITSNIVKLNRLTKESNKCVWHKHILKFKILLELWIIIMGQLVSSPVDICENYSHQIG